MKILPFGLAFFTVLPPLGAQEISQVRWDVSIPTLYEAPSAVPGPAPIAFKDLTSRTRRMDVTEAPEMPDLPPVAGRINVTVKLVEDPNLAPALNAMEPTHPQVIARLKDLRDKYGGMELVFLSCTVYGHHRSLIHIYAEGNADQEVTAWSNVDLNHFAGFSVYRVKDGVQGTLYDYGLLIGLDNQDNPQIQQSAMQSGESDRAVEIPDIPDLVDGPAFVVLKGEANSPAMATLEQIHDLYREKRAEMEASYLAREKAKEQRKAYLLINPPAPSDITIRFWRKPRPQIQASSSSR